MKISNKDWVQLSAYLDGELSGRDQDQLKKKIQTHPDLRAALEELQRTKSILRQAPRLKVPRNFTLNSQMVPIYRRRASFNGYRLAAAVMSFVLVGVLFLDFGRVFFIGAMAPALSPKSEEIMLDTEAESTGDDHEEPALMFAEGNSDQDRVLAESQENLPSGVSAPAPADDDVDQALAVGGEAPAEERTIQAEDIPVEENAAATLGEESTAVPSPTSESQLTSRVGEFDESSTPVDKVPPISNLRLLEILLAVGIVGFGSAAWFKNKRDNP